MNKHIIPCILHSECVLLELSMAGRGLCVGHDDNNNDDDGMGANIVRFSQHNHHFYRLRSSSLGCLTHTHFMSSKVFRKIFAFRSLFQFKMDIILFFRSPSHVVARTRTHFCNILRACMQSLMANSAIMSISLFVYIYCASYKLIIISFCTAICFQCIKYSELANRSVSFLQQRCTENKLCPFFLPL